MSEAYSQTMCRTWTQIATTGAVTSFGEKRYGYRKCGSDIFTFLENTKKHMGSAEKRMVFAQDRFATNGLVRWQNMLVEATDGGEGEEGGAATKSYSLQLIPYSLQLIPAVPA